jgi:hypothetical protein
VRRNGWTDGRTERMVGAYTHQSGDRTTSNSIIVYEGAADTGRGVSEMVLPSSVER